MREPQLLAIGSKRRGRIKCPSGSTPGLVLGAANRVLVAKRADGRIRGAGVSGENLKKIECRVVTIERHLRFGSLAAPSPYISNH